MTGIKKFILLKTVITLICVAMLVISCFCLMNVHRLVTIACLVIFATFSVIIPSISQKYETLLKFLIVAAIFCSISLVIFVFLEKTGLFYKLNDLDTIKNLILETKQWGILTFFIITLFQVIILPIPAAITILIGVAIYGSWISFFVSATGTIIGSIISFIIGRTFGKKIVVWIFGPDKTKKYANFLAKGKFAFIFMMMFPLFPDDLICMLAGITNMSKKFFFIAMSITRTVAIAIYCFFGTGEIIPFRGWGIPVWIGIFAGMIIAYILIEKLIVKRKKIR